MSYKSGLAQGESELLVLTSRAIEWLKFGSPRFWLEGFLVSAAVLIARLPEIFFGGGSLRLTDLQRSAVVGQNPVTGWSNVFKDLGLLPRSLEWWSARGDSGGSIFQSDPAAVFVFNALSAGDSPYWNPYIGNGALGPEALVDLKFSVLTIATAALGNSTAAFNFLMICLLLLSTTSLFVFTRKFIGLSPIAALASILVFSLNGYAVSALGANFSQSYWFLPPLLLTMTQVISRPSPKTVLFAAVTGAATLSATFLPTLITGIAAVAIILLALLFGRRPEGIDFSSWSKSGIFGALSSVILAMFLVAPIYLPLFSSLSWTGLLDGYTSRSYFPILNLPAAIPSIFSPSLFLESYNSLSGEPGGSELLGARAFHLGLVFSLFAGAGVAFRKNSSKLPLTLFMLILVILLRLTTPEPLKSLIGDVPILGDIGPTYWWPALLLPFAILAGLGVERTMKRDPNLILAGTIFLFAAAGVVWHLANRGIVEPNVQFKEVSLLTFCTLGVLAIVLLLTSKYKGLKVPITFFTASLVLAGSLSLLVDSKLIFFPSVGFSASDSIADLVVKDLIPNPKTITIGTDLTRYPGSSVYQDIQDVSMLSEGGSLAYERFFHQAFGVVPEYQFQYSEAKGHGYFPTLYSAGGDASKYDFDFEMISLLGVNAVYSPTGFTEVNTYLEENGLIVIYQDPTWSVLQNPRAFPPVFAVNKGQYEMGASSVNLLVVDVAEIDAVEVLPRTNTRVEAQVFFEEPRLIVFSENAAPGWGVRVNDIESDLVSVEGTFMGVMVDPGISKVEFRYSPPFYFESLVLLLTSVAVLLGLAIHSFLRRKRGAGAIWEFLRARGLEI